MTVEEPKRPKVRIVRVKGRKLLASDRRMTNADTQKVMEQLP
jgi:hypothetical protein